MGPGGTFAFVAFTTGALLLLGWLYATANSDRSISILKKSLYLFLVPMLLVPGQFFQVTFGMWAWIACEEGLKVFASTTEQGRNDKFWLVALFGIWELTIDKPIWGFVLAQSGESWDRLSMAGLLYVTALPVLMHTVTAAIYAFAFERRLWAAFIASWVVHTSFNESVSYFGVSPTAAIIETTVLTILLTALLVRGRRLGLVEGQ